jgi:dienelactone hydrolase
VLIYIKAKDCCIVGMQTCSGQDCGQMLKHFLRTCSLFMLIALAAMSPSVGSADEKSAPQIQEEVWGLLLPLPILAYLVRPVGTGPFPLVIMNYGVSFDQQEGSFDPPVELHAAHWFAHQGYAVVAPIGPSSSSGTLDPPDRELYKRYFSAVEDCDDPYSLGASAARATANKWIIDYMTRERLAILDKVIVVGQSAGGWAAIALGSLNPTSIRAIISFAAGRGGRVDGKPENSCASKKLIAAAREFGRTSRIPMLWIYSSNDTYFEPELSKQVHEAFTGVGGIAEYHLLPPLGSDGEFLMDSPDGISTWAPLVSQFLDKLQSELGCGPPQKTCGPQPTAR